MRNDTIVMMGKFFKTTLAFAAATAVTFTLAACTGDTSNDFDKVAVNTTPHWDLDKVKLNSWDSVQEENPAVEETVMKVETEPTVNAEVSKNGEVEVGSENSDIASYNYIKLSNSKKRCTVEGRIIHLESYRQDRGDLYNSKNSLYDMVPLNQNPVTGETTTVINGNTYVSGYYTTIDEDGSARNHLTAVRVFSTPVQLVGVSGFTGSEFGNHNSDLTVGLPAVVVDLSCSDNSQLTSSTWGEIVKNFVPLFTPLVVDESKS